MKLKSLVVITLLVLGCSAAFGQTYSFGFLSYDPIIQFCDYEVINVTAPFAGGTHNLTTVCGGPIDGVQVGFAATIPPSASAPVTGPVLELADNTFDAQGEYFSGCQINWVTKTKSNIKQLFHYGWSFYFSCSPGNDYLGNYGYLTSALPTPDLKTGAMKSTFGATVANVKAAKVNNK